MTIKDIEYVSCIAKEKSLTKAAAALFVAQPALSQCLHKVESELGVSLFNRSRSGMEPTEFGHLFSAFAEIVLSQNEELHRKIQDRINGECGEIRLGFSGSQASYILPLILPAFQHEHPNISLNVVESLSMETETKLINREIDVAVIPKPIVNENISYFEITHDDMVVFPRKSSAHESYCYLSNTNEPTISMDFFKSEPIVTTFPKQKTRMVTDEIFKKAHISPNIKQLARNIATVKSFVSLDIASAIIPRRLLDTEKNLIVYNIPKEFREPYTYVVATLKDAYISKATKMLMKTFMDSIKM